MAGSTASLTIARVRTVAFLGLDAAEVDVEVQIASGLPSFAIVGLPDKAVAESRERVRAALGAMGLALPPRRIIVNLAPADLAKEGSHFDLPIALGVLIVMGVLPVDTVEQHLVLGELALDGGIRAVAGVLPAAVAAAERGLGLICPAACGAEAAWLKDQVEILAAPSLLALINHARGTQLLTPPEPGVAEDDASYPDLRDVKGQETAKRALEIAAAGAHNLMLVGPPGAGKSMLAARLIGILPPLDPAEVLEVSMIASVGGISTGGRLSRRRPFRSPHHAASTAAMVGGGSQARPGEISLAHLGVLFLDELPEFGRARAGIPAPAARGRPDHGRPRPGPRHLSGALPAGGGDEPLPLRPSRRPGAGLPARAALRRRLPGAHLRAAARPHRPPCRGAGTERRRHDPAAAARGQRRGRGARRRRAPAPVRPVRRHGPAWAADQQRGRRHLLEAVADLRRAGPRPAAPGGPAAASQRTRLPSRPAGGALDRRPRRQRDDPQAAHRRGDRVPARATRARA